MPFTSSVAYSELLLHGQYADKFNLHILMGGTSQYQTQLQSLNLPYNASFGCNQSNTAI